MTTGFKRFFSGWLTHPDGRLKTTRMTLVVFLLFFAAISLVYKAGKSADQMLVSIDHIFEPEIREKDPPPKAVKKPVPDPETAVKAPAAQVTATPPEEEITDLPKAPAPVPAEEPVVPQKTADSPGEKKAPSTEAAPARPAPSRQVENALAEHPDPAKEVEEQPKPVKPLEEEPMPAEVLEEQPLASQTLEPSDPAPEALKAAPAPEEETKTKPDNRIFSEALKDLVQESTPERFTVRENGSVRLPSETYFEVFSQWQNQGKGLDGSRTLVPLRIENLEKVYELFQMKVVAVKDGVPHTDLADGTRLAKGALADFSTTCFVVADPWTTWGKALEKTGFSRADRVEVRYYTYDVVRDAIYARAMKAFDWTSGRIGLDPPYDPSTADVLGQVFAIQRQGGGRFGVFVPVRVDYQSGKTVKVDPLACFTGQKDVEALSRTGLL